MIEVVKEIMERVDRGNIPLEDGEFTIDGVVYRTVEIEGDWKCCFLGVTFDKFQRGVVCEVFNGDMSLNMFIFQYQEKTEYTNTATREYKYGECIGVKRQTEDFVVSGWVKA